MCPLRTPCPVPPNLTSGPSVDAQGISKIVARGPTLVMGVVNVTPDSFYPPSAASDPEDASAYARKLHAQGADILDVGGESSRPGSDPVGADEELRRIVPVFEALSGIGAALSIDTYRAETARRAIELGAAFVNDITALQGDPDMAAVVAESDSDCVLMHMQGDPKTMQAAPHYADVMDEIRRFFEARMEYATSEGIAEERIWLDPGFGFGKTVSHNLDIVRRLKELKSFGRPIVVGVSNKSTIGSVLDLPVNERMEGTAATVAVAIWNGADCVRVHDVESMKRVAAMTDALVGNGRE